MIIFLQLGVLMLFTIVVDFRNNVNFNWDGETNFGNCRMNIINNYYRPGKSTNISERPFRIKAEFAETNARGYLEGNFIEGNESFTNDNFSAINYTNSGKYGSINREIFELFEAQVAGDDIPVTHTPHEAYELVLKYAGASKVRDLVDLRIIESVKDRTNHLIDSQNQVGGWPQLSSSEPKPDIDQDGMPDEWEETMGLNPNDPDDRNGDLNNDGYTNLEEYLNSILTPLTNVGESVFEPQDFLLIQNYPNPFNGSTSIQYVTLKSAQNDLKIYNLT